MMLGMNSGYLHTFEWNSAIACLAPPSAYGGVCISFPLAVAYRSKFSLDSHMPGLSRIALRGQQSKEDLGLSSTQ